MEKQIEVNGVTIVLTEDQVNKILEQTKVKNAKELVKQEILEILEKYKSNVRFLDENCEVSKYPTSRFEILDENGEWLFDIDYDSKNQHFWYSYYRILEIFRENYYSINYNDFQEVMKSILEEPLNLKGVTPNVSINPSVMPLEEPLNLKGVTPSMFHGERSEALEEHLNLKGVTPWAYFAK